MTACRQEYDDKSKKFAWHIPSYLHKDGLNTMVPAPMGKDRKLGGINFAVDLTDKREIDARDELDCRRRIWVVLAASDLEAVDAVLVDGLQQERGQHSFHRLEHTRLKQVLTCPGPMIVPFQWLIMISSPSSRPYEQEPSPMPFSPFSSSSSKRKFLGTVQHSQQAHWHSPEQSADP